MSTKSQTTKTTQQSDPWAPAQPHLKAILGGAQQAYNKGLTNEYFPGSTVAPFSQQTRDALSRMESMANQGSPTLNAANQAIMGQLGGNNNPAMGYLDQTARGDFLNSNPYLDAMFGKASGAVSNTVNSQFSGAGRYGSGSHQDVLQRGLGDLATNIYAGNYAQERQNQLAAQGQLGNFYNTGQDQQARAASMAPGIYDAQFAPSRIIGQVGAMNDQQNQRNLQDLMARYDFGQNNQWNQLQKYAALAAPMGQQGGTQNGTQTTPGQSLLPMIAGLGLTAATGGLGGPALFASGGLLGGAASAAPGLWNMFSAAGS